MLIVAGLAAQAPASSLVSSGIKGASQERIDRTSFSQQAKSIYFGGTKPSTQGTTFGSAPLFGRQIRVPLVKPAALSTIATTTIIAAENSGTITGTAKEPGLSDAYKIDALEKELDCAMNENTKMKADKSRMLKLMAMAKNKIAELEGEIKNLKDGGQDQEPGKNERLKDTILKLKKLGRNLKEKNDKFKIYQVALFKDISEKSTENEKLKEELANLKGDKQTLEKELEKKEKEVKDLEEDVQILKKDRQDLESELNLLEEERNISKFLEKENEEKTSEIEKLKEELKKNQEPAEKTPTTEQASCGSDDKTQEEFKTLLQESAEKIQSLENQVEKLKEENEKFKSHKSRISIKKKFEKVL